jgi:hypothetical protein
LFDKRSAGRKVHRLFTKKPKPKMIWEPQEATMNGGGHNIRNRTTLLTGPPANFEPPFRQLARDRF